MNDEKLQDLLVLLMLGVGCGVFVSGSHIDDLSTMVFGMFTILFILIIKLGLDLERLRKEVKKCKSQ